MSKETLVFLLGVVLVLVPTLGIPDAWREWGLMGIGALLVLVGYILRRDAYLKRIDRGDGERGTDSFVETTERLFDDQALE